MLLLDPALRATASMPPSGIRGDSGRRGVSVWMDCIADWIANARAEVPVPLWIKSAGVRADHKGGDSLRLDQLGLLELCYRLI